MARASLSISLMMLGLHKESMDEADLAISSNPNHAWGSGAVGGTRTFGGRPSEAIEPLAAALRLSPFDPLDYVWRHWMSRAHYLAGDYEAAILVAQRLWRSHPEVFTNARTLIAALGQTGQAEEAQRVRAEGLERFGENFGSLPRLTTHELRSEDREHLLRSGCGNAFVVPNAPASLPDENGVVHRAGLDPRAARGDAARQGSQRR